MPIDPAVFEEYFGEHALLLLDARAMSYPQESGTSPTQISLEAIALISGKEHQLNCEKTLRVDAIMYTLNKKDGGRTIPPVASDGIRGALSTEYIMGIFPAPPGSYDELRQSE